MLISEEKLMEKLRVDVVKAGGVNKLAKRLDIVSMSLRTALAGKAASGAKYGIGEKLAEKLGYRRVVMFEKVKK